MLELFIDLTGYNFTKTCPGVCPGHISNIQKKEKNLYEIELFILF